MPHMSALMVRTVMQTPYMHHHERQLLWDGRAAADVLRPTTPLVGSAAAVARAGGVPPLRMASSTEASSKGWLQTSSQCSPKCRPPGATAPAADGAD
jgi:hypothetical protein